MIARRSLVLAVAVLTALTLLTRLSAAPARAASEPLLLVAGLTFPASDLTIQQVKSAFRGKPVFLESTRLIPLNHPINSPLRAQFDRIVLGLEADEVGRFWVDQRIRDEGKPPPTAPSSELAARVAAELPGAITYVTRSMLNAKLKVLTVDGKSAGQADYFLDD